MIDLDPLWRLVIVFAAFGVIPLLLALGWAVRRAVLRLGMSLHQGGLSAEGVWGIDIVTALLGGSRWCGQPGLR